MANARTFANTATLRTLTGTSLSIVHAIAQLPARMTANVSMSNRQSLSHFIIVSYTRRLSDTLPMKMSCRDEWNLVLALECEQWEAKPWPQVLHDLADGNVAYEVIYDSKTYQVEADLLEDTPEYLHVSVAVDDGSLPESIRPASKSLIRRKSN